MMKKKAQETIAFVLLLAVVLASSLYIGYLLMPERTSYGALWNQFLCEPKDSIDVLVVGSSIAYCDVMPSVIEDNTGYNAYVLAAPEMTASIMYYYVEEALKTQSPKEVLIEATTMFFDKYLNYSKVCIGYMPYGLTRLKATFDAAEENERLGLLFPLYNYHDRWEHFRIKTLFTGRVDSVRDELKGYTPLSEVQPQSEVFSRIYDIGDDELKDNFGYLRKVINLCESNGITVKLFIAPQCQYPKDDLVDKIVSEFSSIDLCNYCDKFDDIGIDLEKDFYDFLHLNTNGATKFSKILCDYITY